MVGGPTAARGWAGGRVGSVPPTGSAPGAMVGPAAVEGHRFAPDAERIRAGWEHRFLAAGERAEEMIALYRELGFEVVADPVAPDGLVDGCATCFGAGSEAYRSIYTRRGPGSPPPRSAG